ncbi:hypothetical protein [Bradyrhizobium sp. WSM1417]|uniref:hypothetical protein n=1 Tax=Bradyrhizobium sp. WSM1417 TaxID=754500 RepID=UPI0004B00DAF|nr:hypothetical protein [Bradyrhizobium sp. WSM1417]
MKERDLPHFLVVDLTHAVSQRHNKFSTPLLQLNEWQAVIRRIIHRDISLSKPTHLKPDVLQLR